MTDFLTRLIGRSSWSLPLAEPVIGPLYSPGHETIHSPAASPFERESVGELNWSSDGRLHHMLARSGLKTNQTGDTEISIPAIPQTGDRRQSHPVPFAPITKVELLDGPGSALISSRMARMAGPEDSPDLDLSGEDERISKDHLGDAPPGRLKGHLSDRPGRAHVSARKKGPESWLDINQINQIAEAPASRERIARNSPEQNIAFLLSHRTPVNGNLRSVPMTLAATPVPEVEDRTESILRTEMMQTEERIGPPLLTAQNKEKSASSSRPQISGWDRWGPRIGEEKRRNSPPKMSSEPPQSIRVTIGRIDVRAVSQQPPARPKPAQPAPDRVPSLEEYMRKRNGGIR